MMLGLVAAPHLAAWASCAQVGAACHSLANWRAGVAWLSLGNCITFTLVTLVGIAARKHQAETAQIEVETAAEIAPSAGGLSVYARTLPFIVGILCFACGTWTQAAFNDLTPNYFAQAPPIGVGFGAVTAGNLFATVLAAGIIGSMTSGVLLDRVFGSRARPLMLSGFAMIAVCVLLLMLPGVYSQRPILILCLFLAGMGTPFVNPIVLAFGAKSFPPSVVPRVIGVWGSVSTLSQGGGSHGRGHGAESDGKLSPFAVDRFHGGIVRFHGGSFHSGAAPRIRSLEHLEAEKVSTTT